MQPWPICWLGHHVAHHTIVDGFERYAPLSGRVERLFGGFLGGLIGAVHPDDVELAAFGIDQRIGFAVK